MIYDESFDDPPAIVHAWQAVYVSSFTPLAGLVLIRLGDWNLSNNTTLIGIAVVASLVVLTGFALSAWVLRVGWRERKRDVLFESIWKQKIRGLLMSGGLRFVINGLMILVGIANLQEAAANLPQTPATPPPPPITSTDWAPAGPGWYVNREHGFALRFPDDWDVQETDHQTTQRPGITALSPPESEDDLFFECIVVRVIPLEENAPPANLEKILEYAAMAKLNGYQLESSGTTTLNGRDCQWAACAVKLGPESLRSRIYYLTANHRAYLLTTLAPPETMPRYEEQFEAILNTFTVAGE